MSADAEPPREGLETDIAWTREALTLLYSALRRDVQTKREDAEEAARESRRRPFAGLAREMMSWLEDASEVCDLMHRAETASGSAAAAGVPELPPALLAAVRGLRGSASGMRSRYATLTSQPLADAVDGVAAAAGAADAAKSRAASVGRAWEAAVWSEPAACRALHAAVAVIRRDTPPGAPAAAELPSAASVPPGHTRQSWLTPRRAAATSAAAAPAPAAAPSAVWAASPWGVPPGHTAASWGRRSALDDVASVLCGVSHRHRAMSQDGAFRHALRTGVAAATAEQAGASPAAGGSRSAGHFAFGLSAVPSVLAVLVDPAAAAAVRAAAAAREAEGVAPRSVVLGSSTGLIPLVLAAATGRPCDGLELLRPLAAMAREEAKAAAAEAAGAAAAWGPACSSGPAAAALSALAGCCLELGDAAASAWPGPSGAGALYLAWLTSLCWDEGVWRAVLGRVVAEAGVGTVVVDYRRPPAALLARGGGRGARRLTGVCRVALPPGAVSWSPVGSGARQAMWVSRVCEGD